MMMERLWSDSQVRGLVRMVADVAPVAYPRSWHAGVSTLRHADL